MPTHKPVHEQAEERGERIPVGSRACELREQGYVVSIAVPDEARFTVAPHSPTGYVWSSDHVEALAWTWRGIAVIVTLPEDEVAHCAVGLDAIASAARDAIAKGPSAPHDTFCSTAGALWTMADLPAPFPDRMDAAWAKAVEAGEIRVSSLAEDSLVVYRKVVAALAEELASELRAALKGTL